MTASYLHGVEVLELATPSGSITTSSSSVIGLIGTAQYADPAIFPPDTPVLLTSGTGAMAKALTATAPANPAAVGTLPQAISDIFAICKTPVVVVRVDQDLTDVGAVQLANQMAEIVGEQAAGTGVYALLGAQTKLGVKPKILIAPGYTGQLPTGVQVNPVTTALEALAVKLRAIVVADGLNDTTTAMVAMGIGNQRVYPVDPWPTILNGAGQVVENPPSAMAAGVIANSDNANGYWWSPSNQPIPGVVGLSRPITFSMNDPTAESNLLNAAGVATIVNAGGFRLWGNRTGDPNAAWQFLSVRRTFDVIEDAVEASFQWALDRPFSAGLLTAIEADLNGFLRGLKAKGAIIDGRCWLDPDLNTAATLAAGQYYVDFDAEPAAPLDRLTFQAQRNQGYYTELLTQVSGSATTAKA